jgi:allantoicase
LPPGADPAAESIVWHPLLPNSELAGDTKNPFSLPLSHQEPKRYTHVRLNIFPDGGVARLRVLGEVLPDWTRILADGGDVDAAAAVHGGYVVDTSDRHYGDPRNMLMPYPAENMGDGWETKRRRGPGHDWAVVRLGIAGVVRRIEIDTRHFKGNYPGSASVDAAVVPDDAHGVSADTATRAIADWAAPLPESTLQADRLHTYEPPALRETPASHVRLNIYPDGGISRFRVFTAPSTEARRAAVLRQLNAMDEPELRAQLAGFNGAPAWIDRMAAARPFTSAAAVLHTSGAADEQVDRNGWLEAFRHHPRIGERAAERTQSASANASSGREQGRLGEADASVREALAQGNFEYERRFGHVFIISAAGKSPRDMLEALRARLANDPETELRLAAAEQKTITRLRLERLLGS